MGQKRYFFPYESVLPPDSWAEGPMNLCARYLWLRYILDFGGVLYYYYRQEQGKNPSGVGMEGLRLFGSLV
jgi:hypothetical protein